MENNETQPEVKDLAKAGIEVVNLDEVLKVPTTVRDETPSKEPPSPKDIPAEFSQDFDQQILENIELPTANTTTIGEASTKLNLPPTELATTIVDFVDMALIEAGPMVYQNLLSPEDRQSLKVVVNQIKTAKIERSKLTIEATTQSLIIDFTDYQEKLPLSTSEKKSLIEPLAKVLENIDYQTTPQNALMISAAFVAVPRVLPLISLYFNKKK